MEDQQRLLNNCASHSRYFSSDELDALFLKTNRTNVCKLFLRMV